MVTRRDVEGTFTIRRQVDLVAAGAQVDAQRAQDLRLVVDDEHTGHRNASRLTTIVRPPPGVSSTVISPPIASTNPRATARPRPVPLPFDWSPSRWKGSKTRCRWSGGMPGPRSTIRRSTRPATAPASTRTGVAGRGHASALSADL